MTDAKIISRAKVLMQAFVDMYNKQKESPYAHCIPKSTVECDGCECDFECLKEEMEYLIEEIKEKEKNEESQDVTGIILIDKKARYHDGYILMDGISKNEKRQRRRDEHEASD